MDTKALLPLKVSYCRKREHVEAYETLCSFIKFACSRLWKSQEQDHQQEPHAFCNTDGHSPLSLVITLFFHPWLLILGETSIKMKPFKKRSKSSHTIMLGFQSPGQSSWGPFKQQSTPLSPADTSTVQLLFILHVDCISQVPIPKTILLHQFLLGGTVTWTKPASANFELRCFIYNGSQNRMLNHRQENKTQYQGR